MGRKSGNRVSKSRKKLTENIFSRLAENIKITDLLITQKTNPFLRL